MALPDAVLRRIGELYGDGERAKVADLLEVYGTEPWERERERVLLGVLLLSGSDSDRVGELISCARKDYRDILLWAEYPEEAGLDTPQKLEQFNAMLRRLGADGEIPGRGGDP